ncbi:MAG: hypothetical protein ACYTGP_11950 [Planctomycetota bacterium]|jgi:hypothetical protein
MNEIVPILLIVHAAATWFMTGLIWFVQVVHYPLMKDVGAASWTEYERRHVSRTSFVVLPAMLVELGCAVGLLVADPGGLVVAASMLLGVIWVSTFAVQVPVHRRLERGFEAAVHRRLVRTNWIRTVAWSGRAVLAAAMLAPAA